MVEIKGGNREGFPDASVETDSFLGKGSAFRNVEIIIPYNLGSKQMEKSNQSIMPISTTLNQSKKNPGKAEKTGWRRYIGILLALGSCLTFSLCVLIVKYMNGKIGPASFVVYRFLGVMLSVPVLLYYRFYRKAKVFEPIWPLDGNHKENIKTAFVLLLRGLTGCTSIMLQYFAVSYISIASATTISFSTPIFVGLTAWLCLGEKCGVIPTVAALVTLVGVVITAGVVPDIRSADDQSTDADHIIGAALAFGSMIFATTVFIILRYLRRVHFSLVTTSFGIIGLIESGIVCAVIGQFDLPTSPWETFLVCSIAVLTLLSQTLMTCALKFEDAGPISLVRTADVVFAFIWQYIFLGVNPDVYTSIGALIVCLGVGLTGFRKYLTTLPVDHKRRKTFGFMLK